jgi:hypothetical protein
LKISTNLNDKSDKGSSYSSNKLMAMAKGTSSGLHLNNSGKKIVNNSNLSFNDFLLMQKIQNNSTKSVNPYNISKNK